MVDIEQLTLAQVRQLSALLGGSQQSSSIGSDLVGRYCIVRSRDSGVHAGTVTAHAGDQVRLKDSRRLWYWRAPKNHTLTAVGLNGCAPGSKISPINPDLLVIGVCEISPCTDEARKSIEEFVAHDPN